MQGCSDLLSQFIEYNIIVSEKYIYVEDSKCYKMFIQIFCVMAAKIQDFESG